MGAELQSPESWKGFRAWIPRARLFLEAERRACHREMSHAQGKGLMDFCATRQLFTGADLEATERQTAKGGVGSGLMMRPCIVSRQRWGPSPHADAHRRRPNEVL